MNRLAGAQVVAIRALFIPSIRILKYEYPEPRVWGIVQIDWVNIHIMDDDCGRVLNYNRMNESLDEEEEEEKNYIILITDWTRLTFNLNPCHSPFQTQLVVASWLGLGFNIYGNRF